MAFFIAIILGTINTFYAALVVSNYWGWFAKHVPMLEAYTVNFWQALCMLLLISPFIIFHYRIPTNEAEIKAGGTIEHIMFASFTRFLMLSLVFGLGFVYNIFING